MRKCSVAIVAPLLAVFLTVAGAAGGYHFVKKIAVPGEGGWDYLIADSSARRLYVSHGTKVDVLDLNTEKVVGSIPARGVHGIALAADLGKGFISNGQGNDVTIFDLKTLQVTGEAKAGENPDAILYDPATKRVFAFNGRSANVTAIDAATGKVIGTTETGGKPEFAATDGAGHIFVNVEDKNAVMKMDAKTLAILARWPLSPCQGPSGLAFDVKNKRLFSGCDNKMMAVTNSETGKQVATVPIGEGVDATAFDPGTGLIFDSNGGDGTLTVIHQDTPDKYTVVENAKTEKGARTMALDLKTHMVYLPLAQFGPKPAPTKEVPKPRAPILPNSFNLIVMAP